jgi:hypothetical protein
MVTEFPARTLLVADSLAALLSTIYVRTVSRNVYMCRYVYTLANTGNTCLVADSLAALFCIKGSSICVSQLMLICVVLLFILFIQGSLACVRASTMLHTHTHTHTHTHGATNLDTNTDVDTNTDADADAETETDKDTPGSAAVSMLA